MNGNFSAMRQDVVAGEDERRLLVNIVVVSCISQEEEKVEKPIVLGRTY